MNDDHSKRAAVAAGLALWPLCALAADTGTHLVSANASKTAPAKILVFIVKNKGAPLSRDASSGERP